MKALWLVALLWSSAAAQPAMPPAIVLFGEVHDNAAQHALRLDEVRAMLAAGARPALLMEQFDRERQRDIDRVGATTPRPDADALILAGSGAPASDSRGWNWAYYRPMIELALVYDLPIFAANVSRTDTRRVISDGLAASGFDADVPPAITRAQADAIERSHCGTLDASQSTRMAAAQIARDQFMARLVTAHAARGVLLLAGNGHVRTDIGVPRWLPPAVRERTQAIGMLESGDDVDRTGYDRVVVTPAQARDDPCAALLRPVK